MNKNYYVAIMAGGIGSRFWPVSRTDMPKQFLDILHTGKTLIQWTFERFAQFIPIENIYVVTNHLYRDTVHHQLSSLPEDNIVCEPSRKNTAPCIAYISYKILKQNPAANFICAPADHLVMDSTAFVKVCLEALHFVESHPALITLGITPTRPDTGYGYIQYETEQEEKSADRQIHAPAKSRPADKEINSSADEAERVADNVYKVKTFTEKPNLELARTFLQSGDFLWNAGIFVWNVKSITNAFRLHLPEVNELFEPEMGSFNTPQEKQVVEIIYSQCTNISIDYGIMEKADNVYVIPANFGWSDLGTWASAYENLEKDYLGNAVTGKNVVVIDATRCMIKAPHDKLVVLQGLDDFILIDTPDVLLVCKRENEQQIKDFVAEVKRNKGEKYL